MVEVTKIGNKTLVMDGKILSLFKKGSLLRQMYYGGYEDFDGANGGVWKKYINIPIKTVPLEYAQYLIEIDDTNVSVYNAKGDLKAQASIASEFWSLVRSDGFDIRAFDHLFKQLYFWVEEFDYTNKKAKIWVKLPENSEELNIACGNPLATTSVYMNGCATFEDFGVDISVTGGEDYWGSKQLLYGVFEARATTVDASWWDIGVDNGAGDLAVFRRPIAGGMVIQVRNENNVAEKSITAQFGTHNYKIVWQSGSAKFYIDDEFQGELTSNVPDEPCSVIFRSGDTNPQIDVAWYYFAKLADPADFGTPRIMEF